MVISELPCTDTAIKILHTEPETVCKNDIVPISVSVLVVRCIRVAGTLHVALLRKITVMFTVQTVHVAANIVVPY